MNYTLAVLINPTLVLFGKFALIMLGLFLVIFLIAYITPFLAKIIDKKKPPNPERVSEISPEEYEKSLKSAFAAQEEIIKEDKDNG